MVKANVISLESRKDRRDTFVTPDGMVTCFYRGIDGSQYEDIPVKFRGQHGCFLSHKLLLMELIVDDSVKEDDFVFIFEDDCDFVDPKSFLQSASTFINLYGKDVSMFFFGGNPQVATDYDKGLERVTSIYQTHAYAIKRKSIKGLLIHLLKQKKTRKIDVAISDYLTANPEFIALLFSPAICNQKPGYSNIQNRQL